jgi:23S rRNA pseudouridine1911/1915/1917 synthase
VSEEDELLDDRRWVVDKEDAGARLDHFLRNRHGDATRSRLKKLINTGYVSIDGEVVVRPASKIREGEEVVLILPPPEALSVCPQEMSLDIRYEDDYLLVVNKPQGLVVHPAPGHSDGTLINGILFGRTAKGGDPLRPGIVHRLDKDTSGLLVVAKTENVHAHLAEQFHDHSVDRRYRVLVAGKPPQKGEWKTLYGRHPRDRRRFSSKVRRGKEATSLFATAERFKGAAMLKVTLMTGRTHQVRVHCYDHGFPVLGDPWYGPRHLSPELFKIHRSLPGQALHAELLGFQHPATGERLRFESTPPEPFQEAVNALR